MRRFIGAFLFVLLCLSGACAQGRDDTTRLGVLATSSEARLRGLIGPELEKIGLFEGRNLALDIRVGTSEEMPRLAQELLALQPKVVIASGGPAILAAKGATTTIPIVMFGADPVELGFVQSLSRPGANVTGIATLSRELNSKRLELLYEALPSARRIAVLVNPSAPVGGPRGVIETGARLGVEVLVFEASGPEQYASAFRCDPGGSRRRSGGQQQSAVLARYGPLGSARARSPTSDCLRMARDGAAGLPPQLRACHDSPLGACR
jgi:putative tryptophan/tyrosine transport system substrate-binding protein